MSRQIVRSSEFSSELSQELSELLQLRWSVGEHDLSLVTARQTISARPFILLQLSHESHRGFGEAAPLPAFGGEDWDTCLHAIERLPQQANRGTWYQLCAELESTAPCAAFALSCALQQISPHTHLAHTFHLAGQGQGQSTHKRRTISIPVNALARDIAECEHYLQQGWQCIKIKVPAKCDDAIQVLTSYLTLIQSFPGAQLRPDANGSWSLDDAHRVSDFLAPHLAHIDYLEQPCGTLTELAHLKEHTDIPIAADESIRSPHDLTALLDLDAADVCVVKPMLIGRIDTTAQVIEPLIDAGRRVICTSTIDGPVARRAVARLIDQLALPTEFHGLATGHLLTNNAMFPDSEVEPTVVANAITFDCEVASCGA